MILRCYLCDEASYDWDAYEAHLKTHSKWEAEAHIRSMRWRADVPALSPDVKEEDVDTEVEKLRRASLSEKLGVTPQATGLARRFDDEPPFRPCVRCNAVWVLAPAQRCRHCEAQRDREETLDYRKRGP